MSEFNALVIDLQGRRLEKVIDAPSREAALEMLNAEKLQTLALSESGSVGRGSKLSRRRLNKSDVLNMTEHMSHLLEAGLPLTQAIEHARNQSACAEMHETLTDIGSKVEAGETLSNAMSKHPRAFSELYVSMVRAGETGGFLDKALSTLADMLGKDEELRSRVKGAMTYPLIMFSVLVLSVVILMSFVIPSFVGMFQEMGGSLPWPTALLIDVSSLFEKGWWALLMVAGLLFAAYRTWTSRPDGRLQRDTLLLNTPALGPMVHQVSLSRVCLTLSALLKSGVPILQAMDSAADVAGNATINRALLRAREELSQGLTLAKALKSHGSLFPDLLIGFASTGENAGNLDVMLHNAGTYFEKQSDKKVKALTTLMEPVIILTMGLVVGFIIVAMLLPIFDMSSNLH